MHSTHFLHTGFQLAVIALLTVVPSIYAIPNFSQPPRSGVYLRDFVDQRRDFPAGWSSFGCYVDDPERPPLTSLRFESDLMTVKYCVDACNGDGHFYAGLENSRECKCGNVMTAGATSAPAEECNLPCFRNASEICGGTNRLSVYTSWTGPTPPPQPTLTPNVGPWTLMGCYSDTSDARTLAEPSPGNLTSTTIAASSVENCTGACSNAGFRLAGVEFASECWCDNDIRNNAQKIDAQFCPLACPWNSTESCGGSGSLVIYQNTISGT